MNVRELILETAREGGKEGLFDGVVEEAFRDYAGRTGWNDVVDAPVVERILSLFDYEVNPEGVAEELLERAKKERIESLMAKGEIDTLRSLIRKDLRALAVMDARLELDYYLKSEFPAVWALLQTVVEDDREAEEYMEYHGERFLNNLSRALTSPTVKVEPFIAGFPCMEGYDEHVFVAVKDRINGIKLLGGIAPLNSVYEAFIKAKDVAEKQAELVRDKTPYRKAVEFIEKTLNSLPLVEELLTEKKEILLENDGMEL